MHLKRGSLNRDKLRHMKIFDHHQRAIDRLADAYRDDPNFRALIIGGSIAKGCARPDSDVDSKAPPLNRFIASSPVAGNSKIPTQRSWRI